MKKNGLREGASQVRREQIINAALACFLEKGINGTTMAMIRERAGASIGSLYHHYKSKEELACRLYIEGLGNYQSGFIAQLREFDDAEEGIKGLVGYHLDWIDEHPAWARYLFYQRQAELGVATARELKQLNRELFRNLQEWLDQQITNRKIKELPLEIFSAVVIGPCQEFARHYLAGRSRIPLATAKSLLATAAWQAIRVNN